MHPGPDGRARGRKAASVGQADTSDDLLQRGMKVATTLPAPLADEARHLVAMGVFETMDEFLFVATSAYLDLRRHRELLDLVETGEAPDPAMAIPDAAPVTTSIPGHMAVRAAGLVANGTFPSLDAFLAAAAAGYLHLRADPDLMCALDSLTVEAALERPGMPLREAVAVVRHRLTRLPPLSATEAVEAMRWSGARVA